MIRTVICWFYCGLWPDGRFHIMLEVVCGAFMFVREAAHLLAEGQDVCQQLQRHLFHGNESTKRYRPGTAPLLLLLACP